MSELQVTAGRLIDIPYSVSPPLIFTYRATAPLALGKYDFGGVTTPIVQQNFTPSRPILPNAWYYFSTLSFSMDIDPNDYQNAIDVLPQFSMYVEATGRTPALREPIVLDSYTQNLQYILWISGASSSGNVGVPGKGNRLIGAISGSLKQTASMVGKTSLTGIVKLTCQEISDRGFIQQFLDLPQKAGATARPQGRVF